MTHQGTATAVTLLCALSFACSSAQKKPSAEPTLSRLHGKKVAIIDIDGEETARNVVTVALANQVQKNGNFELVSREDVEDAKKRPDLLATDWISIARAANADYALKAKVIKFYAENHEGVSSEDVDDSELEAEMGPGQGKTKNYYKVKSLDGDVAVQLDFTNLQTGENQSGIARATDRVVGEARTEGISLPPRLRFLERLCNEAFEKFFKRYQ